MVPRGIVGVAVVHAAHQASQLAALPDPGWLIPFHLAAIPLAIFRPRLSMSVVAALGVVQCVMMFPRTANHLYLGVVVSLLLALLLTDDEDDGRQLRLSALALPLIVFAWSGVQKALHGYWFQGQLLAWVMVARDDVAFVARPMLDDAVAKHLGGLDRHVEGSGPFRLNGAWILVSNGIWLAELFSPLLALVAFIRARLWWLLLIGLWAIQLVAHEWQFALLFTNVLTIQAPPKRQRLLRPLILLALVVLTFARAVNAGWMPQVIR